MVQNSDYRVIIDKNGVKGLIDAPSLHIPVNDDIICYHNFSIHNWLLF